MAAKKKRKQTIARYKTGRVLIGSCLDRLKDLGDGSVDSIVTDPPYELGFMGKSWDASGIAYQVELWQECLRVLKPGGHLLAFGGTRTYHRMTCAIEDAGFEIRDSLHWVYGSGFPKSHDVSKAIDKAAGAEREVVGTKKSTLDGTVAAGERDPEFIEKHRRLEFDITAPATNAAKQWQGWGTALKPAHEPIVVARKPLMGTVAANVLEHGTGALNIDGCRVAHRSEADRAAATPQGRVTSNKAAGAVPDVDGAGRVEIARPDTSAGRWPANIIFDEAAGAELDAQSGVSKDGVAGRRTGTANGYDGGWGAQADHKHGYGGQGGASRFFYCPKPGKKERNAGLDELPTITGTVPGPAKHGYDAPTWSSKNFHPTVKPVELMRWLVRLVTPEGGTVLDPFLGSGTTAVAAILEGFEWIGCEMTADYLPIIKGRVQWAQRQQQPLL